MAEMMMKDKRRKMRKMTTPMKREPLMSQMKIYEIVKKAPQSQLPKHLLQYRSLLWMRLKRASKSWKRLVKYSGLQSSEIGLYFCLAVGYFEVTLDRFLLGNRYFECLQQKKTRGCYEDLQIPHTIVFSIVHLFYVSVLD